MDDQNTIHELAEARKKHDFANALQRLPYGLSCDQSRTCLSKRVATALYLGGVRTLRLSTSFWCGGPPSISGLLLCTNSLEATPYIQVFAKDYPNISAEPFWPGKTTLLIAVLRKCGYFICGGANPTKNWMQASGTLGERDLNGPVEALNGPLVCAYFDEIKRLDEAGQLDWGWDRSENYSVRELT